MSTRALRALRADPAMTRQQVPADVGRGMVRRLVVLGGLVCAGANTLSSIIVFILLVFVLPTPEGVDTQVTTNLVLAAVYVPLALALGILVGTRRARRRLTWLREGRAPDDAERRGTLGLTFTVTRVQMRLWLVAAVLFGVLNGLSSVLLAVEVVLTVIIGGFVSSATTYLTVERINRPVMSVALADAPLGFGRGASVTSRTVGSWTLGTALPVSGLVLLNGLAIGLDIERVELAVASFVLGLTALVFGLLITVVFARSVADPLRELRRAIGAVTAGDTSVAVAVTDATEVGVVQTGFNQMVAGLAERDRVRDLFGRHVGEDVARQALKEGVELGGEVRDVAVVFVDVISSTSLAEQDGAVRTVEQLNDLFAIVLDVVDTFEGTVTAFAGDAALCVWGAPLSHPSPELGALAAAREIGRRTAGVPGVLDVGIGAASGPVVAGNIGARQRVEYTVIGDAVNAAARLCDHAKSVPGRVVADARTVAAAPSEEPLWRTVEEVVLRGRSTATQVAVPVEG